MTSAKMRGFLAGLATTSGLATVDALLGPTAAISGSYMLGAIVAAVLAGVRAAVVIAVLAFVLASLSGIWNEDFFEVGYFSRLGIVVAGDGFAILAGRYREQLRQEIDRQGLLAAIADLPRAGETVPQTVERVLDLLVPLHAGFGAVESDERGERTRLGFRGTEPIDTTARVVTPLRARGREIAWLTTSGRGGIGGDRDFMRILGGRIALALDNAGLSQELTSVEQQLEAILQNLGEAVTVQDLSGRLVFANQAAADLLGCESVEELLATPVTELVERFATFNEDGTPFRLEQAPGRQVLAGERAEPLVVRAVNLETGKEHWRVTKSTPVRGPMGEVQLAVNVIEDITDSKRAELTQRLLADASAILASSVDYTETLQRVADLVGPALGERCTITVAEEERTARAEDATVAAEVLRTGRSRLTPEEIVVPLASPERTLGTMSLESGESGRRFSESDLTLAEELGRRAGTALENARLYTQLERVAVTLQRSLLPPSLPNVAGWRFASLYMPAVGETEVGGDFYDVFRTAAGWMAVIGDVAGRGAAAASLTAMGRYTLRTAGSLVGTPTMGLARLNENLRARGDTSLCTAAVALLREDSDEASLVSAGHPLPYLVRGGSIEAVGRTGPLLGAFDQGHWLPASVRLERGDVLVMYTDGVLDARGPVDRFGETRLEEALRGSDSAQDAVDRIQTALQRFAGTGRDDDTAVLAIQRV